MSKRHSKGFPMAMLLLALQPVLVATNPGWEGNHWRMTPVDAEKICQREARARFSPGNGEISGVFLPTISTRDTYRVAWRYYDRGWTIRKGQCDIDSMTGHLRKFKANDGW